MSDLVVVMQQKHTIILIKYNNNSLDENDEEGKEPINIDLTEQKTDPFNNENAIDFRWSDAKEEKRRGRYCFD